MAIADNADAQPAPSSSREITPDTEDTGSEQDSTPWYKKVSVEPSMALYMFAFMFTSVVEQAYFVHKTCTVNHNYTDEQCDEFAANKSLPDHVQVSVSNFLQWNNVAGHVFPIVIAMFLGAWSDKRGRKFPLLMGLVGKLVYTGMLLINISQKHWPVEYIIYTATLPSAITGADIAIFASCFAYISDLSSMSDRTIRINILDVCYMAAMPTGVALGKYMWEVFDHSYFWMFTVNGTLLVIAIIYSFVALKWQTTAQQKPIRELGCCGIIPDFFDTKHFTDSIKVLVRRREMHRRAFLAMMLLTMALYTFQRDEKSYMYMYTNSKFGWTVSTYSTFRALQSTAYVFAMLIGVPVMSKIFKFRDTIIIMTGATAHAIARVFYVFAEVPWVFYIGSFFCSFGPIVGPVLRSMTSKIVPLSERGKVFALLSVCDNAVPFISSVLYTQVFNATFKTFGGIYVLTFATQVGVFLLILIIHLVLRGRSFEVAEVEKDDALIN